MFASFFPKWIGIGPFAYVARASKLTVLDAQAKSKVALNSKSIFCYSTLKKSAIWAKPIVRRWCGGLGLYLRLKLSFYGASACGLKRLKSYSFLHFLLALCLDLVRASDSSQGLLVNQYLCGETASFTAVPCSSGLLI